MNDLETVEAILQLCGVEYHVIEHSVRMHSIDVEGFVFRLGFFDGALQGKLDTDEWCSALINRQR